MSDKVTIQVESLTKAYKLYESPLHRLKESIHPLRKKYHRDFYALHDINFEVKRGETLGIIGKNGCGKSTLLKIIAGVLTPTSGSVHIKGKVSALLELGAGFNPELTGMENIYFSGTVMGLSRAEMDTIVDRIVEFADIGEFIYQPVKMYSSGMFVRLAFAVATCVSPEILIVDEALSVGDIFFQQKCHELMENLMRNGTSVILVSHDMAAIEKYSTSVMVLDCGKTIFKGHPNEGVQHYYELMVKKQIACGEVPLVNKASSYTHAVGDTCVVFDDWPGEAAFLDLANACSIGEPDWVRCTAVALCNQRGEATSSFRIGETAVFYTEYEILKDIMVPIGGISIVNRQNLHLFTKGSLHYCVKAPSAVKAGQRVRFRQEVVLALAPDEYTFWPMFATMNSYDYAHARDMEHAILFNKIIAIIRVTRIGAFSIYADRFLPFSSYVDLPGKCALSII